MSDHAKVSKLQQMKAAIANKPAPVPSRPIYPKPAKEQPSEPVGKAKPQQQPQKTKKPKKKPRVFSGGRYPAGTRVTCRWDGTNWTADMDIPEPGGAVLKIHSAHQAVHTALNILWKIYREHKKTIAVDATRPIGETADQT